ncbi:uncharacterized protein BJX67DRAFT_197026 [Aspergillus lucknowensis]|uniref:Uncharacterized protein n=1 Tax=Aspergillus lucknowensis TaxID=176173 RepID=A0ABR4LK78_9EURO
MVRKAWISLLVMGVTARLMRGLRLKRKRRRVKVERKHSEGQGSRRWKAGEPLLTKPVVAREEELELINKMEINSDFESQAGRDVDRKASPLKNEPPIDELNRPRNRK